MAALSSELEHRQEKSVFVVPPPASMRRACVADRQEEHGIQRLVLMCVRVSQSKHDELTSNYIAWPSVRREGRDHTPPIDIF